MSDAFTVQKLDSADNLIIEATGLFLGESIFAHNIVEEFTTAGIFHYQENTRLSFYNLI